jgi:hypothetical protein
MGFMLSPGVTVKEWDLSGIIPGVATTAGATVGAFQWGPVEEITTIGNESDLVKYFGKPNDETFEYWFNARNFLAYGNRLNIVRVVDKTKAKNAASDALNAELIENRHRWDSDTTKPSSFYAKYAGIGGNSIKIVIATATTYAGIPAQLQRFMPSIPVGDEMHVLILDALGYWTGEVDQILETYSYLSTIPGAKKGDGSPAYYPEVLNRASGFIYAMDNGLLDVTGYSVTLEGGVDGNATITTGELMMGYDLYVDPEQIDISLIPIGPMKQSGPVNRALATYVINNIAEKRMDCIVIVGAPREATINNFGHELPDVKDDIDLYPSSSYAVYDCTGYKYQYDKYNDTYRWVALNSDVAGLCVRTDMVADPWYSPAGFNRGQIKDCVKLAWNPKQFERDILYPARANPICQFPGEGTILYGDRTMQTKPSAFDRINVRRLFIVLEKAIAKAAKYQLFELNDKYTRLNFKNMVEPFLRDVQGRRGIYDFKVVCDESNNTPEVIDRNEFIASIFIKPARSINFITLNFVAVRTGVNFDEVVGQIQ